VDIDFFEIEDWEIRNGRWNDIVEKYNGTIHFKASLAQGQRIPFFLKGCVK
jgi:hypothetical protein